MLQFPKGIGEENLGHFRENPLNHIGLVVSIVEEYLGRGIEFDDLVTYGVIGLLKACKRYDEKYGTKFSTYGRYWIDVEIKRAFRVEIPFIQVPEYMYSRRKKVDRGELELGSKSQKNMEAARKVWNLAVLGIAQGSDGNGQDSGGEGLIVDCLDPDDYDYVDDYDFLRKALTNLEVPEQRILIMYYFQGMTIKRICEALGVCKVTVCKTKNRALQKLRESLGAVEV